MRRCSRRSTGGGGLFFRMLSDRVAALTDDHPPQDGELATALWDLAWAGLVTNDTLAPVRVVLGGGGQPRRSGARGAAAGAPGGRSPRDGVPGLGGPVPVRRPACRTPGKAPERSGPGSRGSSTRAPPGAATGAAATAGLTPAGRATGAARAARRCRRAPARPASPGAGPCSRTGRGCRAAPTAPRPRCGRTLWRSRCWIAMACSPGARWPPSGCRAASRRCTPCCGRWRRPASAGEATSSRDLARPSSRCRAPSTGCGRWPGT